jgi:hypothetical protein
MAAALSPVPRQTFFANDGSPLAGGAVYTYSAGTLTPKTMYSDTGLTVPISNPIVLNSAGRPQASAIDTTEVGLYPQSGSYKWIVKNSSGTTIWTQDNIPSDAIAAGTVTSVGLSMPSIFTVANSPVTSTGTLTVTNAVNTAFGTCQGRLTGTSGSAVTTGNVANITTIYFTPYHGNLIDLFDGVSAWNRRKFTEISVALGTLTSGLPYDVFCYDNAGTPALRSPVAWTSTSARATAITLQDGIYVKSGATTDRYLGTFYTTSTTQTQDTVQQRYLWNYYNRVKRPLERFETTANWTYSTATVRQANGSTSNQVEAVIGVAEAVLDLNLTVTVANNNGGIFVSAGIGEDSTTAYTCGWLVSAPIATTQGAVQVGGRMTKYPAVGRHFYSWNEWSTATPTTTWYSGGSVGSTTTIGLEGAIDG